ncbi:NAD-dependent epimerase/dehydratase family protein, partial [Acidobacteriota bacterium]
MKILLTGGAGFIGSHVADAYIKDGHEVIVVDNLSTGKRSNLNTAAKFCLADITDENAINSLIETEKPEIINHHAAHVDVRRSMHQPVFDASSN